MERGIYDYSENFWQESRKKSGRKKEAPPEQFFTAYTNLDVPVSELAKMFNVCERTILRYRAKALPDFYRSPSGAAPRKRH